MDFDSIENGVGSGAAKYMDCYSAIGLMMTLVWLYLEILRFVSYFMETEVEKTACFKHAVFVSRSINFLTIARGKCIKILP